MLKSSHLLACIFTVSVSLAQGPRPMTLVDVLNVPQVSDPQLSPDGRQILYVLAESNWKANKRVSHIWKINADGSGLLELTTGPDGESTPRWSPDGKTIAFVAKRAEAEANQIYLLSNGGGEARALTTHSTAVSNIAWSPDGSLLYFRAPNPKSEQKKTREKLKDDVFLFDEDYQQQHLWSIAVSTKVERRITDGNYSVMSYQLSRDGSKIALHRAPTPLLEDMDQSEVWVMDSSGGAAQQITHNKVAENGAELSPDGSQVLFLSQANQKFDTYYNSKLFLAPAAGGEARVLIPDLPYEIERAAWSKDGKSIFFLANMGVHAELFEVNAVGGKPRQLTNGTHAITQWNLSESANQHVFTALEMSSPGEVWILDATGSSPRKVTSVFESLTHDFSLPRQERVEWKGADGTTVEGLVYYPINYVQGQRYPLVVQTHGGPQASDKFGFGGTQKATSYCSPTIAEARDTAMRSYAIWWGTISRTRISTSWQASII
jgi:dipeptidyl aminopeptidase/acylaminoacyl peptidase